MAGGLERSLGLSSASRLPLHPVPDRPLSSFGYVRAMRRSLIDGFDASSFREPMVSRALPGLAIHLLNAPEAIKHVSLDNAENYIKSPLTSPIVGMALGEGLVTSEGAAWRSHRKLMSPAFEPREIASYLPQVRQALLRSFDRLRLCADNKDRFSLKAEMMALTLDIISNCMFSADDNLGSIFNEASHRYQAEIGLSPAVMIPVIRTLWYASKRPRVQKILDELDGQMLAMIKRRRRTDQLGKHDLLNRLLNARDDAGHPMPDKLVRDQMVTIFVAGHETTALALMWSLLLISTHPDVLRKARREIDQVVGDGDLEYRHVKELTYVGQVFQEALRLYPPVHSMAWRTPLKDDVIQGQAIKAGSIVAIIPWVVHRHHLYWTDPDLFDPERFSEVHTQGRSRYSYIPFGAGSRTCIGAAFSMMEGILSLAALIRNFDFKIESLEGLEPRGLITLHPEVDPRIMVSLRQQ